MGPAAGKRWHGMGHNDSTALDGKGGKARISVLYTGLAKFMYSTSSKRSKQDQGGEQA